MAATAALALTGCGPDSTASTSPSSPATTTSTFAPSTTTTTPPPPPTTTTTSSTPALTGKVVVLDPGHNGGNASHPSQINALVPAGRGQEKACNTTGTATNAGYSEHAFNWDVANRVEAELKAKGVTVVMTRSSDTGVGPCVNERAAIGNNANAAAVVSIHADGSDTPGTHGFHVEYSKPPLNAEQGPPSIQLATVLRDDVRAAGFTTANYIGSNGLFGRDDLGGLNLSTRPTVLIECGNMRNAGDAATLTSADGRQHIADGITAGIIAYLGGATS
ncbi:MAG TPA: N-acetylmuramoyl-L-alanine amidase [Pseudonocardiaceae bacterium]|nr:N-acetylmuramoyl-L-alanine amidase [Pseudonocardiaceae bacterium]